jgi:hypothetical protein
MNTCGSFRHIERSTMNYNEWGTEYLKEAEKLKQWITPLRRQTADADSETAAKLYRRISVLNEMYLDCLHTGQYLMQSGAKR